MEKVAVELKGITYAYPDGHVALQEVNLKVACGERLAILGANGAGKSTSLMLMNGLYVPSAGTVTVLGNPATAENLSTIRRQVGLVFQDPDDQLFCPTLWDDICFGPLNMGLSEEDVKESASDALKAMRLKGYANKPPHHLSAGEKKRAAIATVLAMHPKVLILDEPTANLDPKSRLELANLLRMLHENHDMTQIIATHDVNFVPMVTDRACVLKQGHVTADGPLREVFSNHNVLEEANIEPPIVTQIFQVLNKDRAKRLPLTVEEAASELCDY